jgi:hypothetical protein
MNSPISSAGPATAAVGASTANTPAPIIDPRPMITASAKPRRRARGLSGADAAVTPSA